MKWKTTTFNHGVKLHPMDGGELKFTFPGRSGYVNFLKSEYEDIPLEGAIVMIRMAVHYLSGSPVFKSKDKPTDDTILVPNVRAAIGGDSFETWWSRGHNQVKLGKIDHMVLSVPILHEFWTDGIERHEKIEEVVFKNFIKERMNSIALLFSGYQGFEQGVYVEGGKA